MQWNGSGQSGIDTLQCAEVQTGHRCAIEVEAVQRKFQRAAGRAERVLEIAGGDPEAVRGEMVQQAAREGDDEAIAVIDDFGRWVALGLVNLTNVLDPERFVLGGGLAVGADLYLDPIKKWFGELIYQPELRPMPEVVFARWNERAGAVGAALLHAAHEAA